jgi:hypothetical protein
MGRLETKQAHSRWRTAAFLGASVAVSLLLGEAAVRVAGRVLHRIPVVAGDEVLGWTGWPNLDRATKDYSRGGFRLSTDSVGHRIAYAANRAPINEPVVLLVGDSFVQGVGVDDDQTIAWRLAQQVPERQIIDLGVAGYGTDQELLSVEKFFRARRDSVSDIVVVMYENDFRDVQASFDYALARSKPTFRLNGQRLERNPYAQSFLDHLMDYSRLVWLGRTKVMYSIMPPKPAPGNGVDLVNACLAAIRKVGNEHNARVHVFAHRQLGAPYGFASEVPDSTWTEFIRRSGAVDMTSSIRGNGSGPNPIGFDGLHWSAEGTRRVSNLIVDSLRSPHP